MIRARRKIRVRVKVRARVKVRVRVSVKVEELQCQLVSGLGHCNRLTSTCQG